MTNTSLDKEAEAPSSIKALNMGAFGLSHEFTKADPGLLEEITALAIKGSLRGRLRQEGSLERHVKYFSRFHSTAGSIIVDFLTAASNDIASLLTTYRPNLSLEHVTADPLETYLQTNSTLTPNRHTDPVVQGYHSVLGLRYITVNHTPTLIDELPDFAAGDIARMPRGRTVHTHGYSNNTNATNPRLLLRIDV